jgi:hypothetical protein
MLLGFTRAVGRCLGITETIDLGEAFRLALQNPDHSDPDELLRAAYSSDTAELDLDEELVTAERYLALFEALNWAVSLDERLAKEWPFEEIEFGEYWHDDFAGGGLIRGLRYARNGVHHDWSLALDLDPTEILFQQRVELLWLAWVEDLQSGRPDPDGKRAYDEYLAGRSVGDTLIEIGDVFGAGVRFAMGGIPRERSGPAAVKQSPEDRYVPDDLPST